MRRLLLFVLLVLGPHCRSQEHFSYTKIDGLPSNNVYQVVRGPNNFLWAATEDGVARFDGELFRFYTTAEGLSTNENFEIKIFDSQIYLLGINGTVSKYNSSSDSFKKEKIQFENFVSEYYITKEGRKIYASFGDGLKIVKGNIVDHITQEDGLTDNGVCYSWAWGEWTYAITKLGIDRIDQENKVEVLYRFPKRIHFARAVLLNDALIFTAGEFVYRLDKKERITILQQVNPITTLIPTKFQKVEGDLIISSYQGAHIVSLEGGTIEIERSFLEDYTVTSVCTDHEGNYWASTLDNGILKVPDIHLFQLTKEATYGIEQNQDQVLVGLKGFQYLDVTSSVKRIALNFRRKAGFPKIRDLKFEGDNLWLENDGALVRIKNNFLTYYRTGVSVISMLDSSRYIVGHVNGAHLVDEEDLTTLSGDDEVLIMSLKKPLLKERVFEVESSHNGHLLGAISGLYVFEDNKIRKPASLPSDKVTYIVSKGVESIVVYENLGAFYLSRTDTISIFSNSGTNRLVKCAAISDSEIILGTNKGVYLLDKKEGFQVKNQILLSQTEIRDIAVRGDSILISSEHGLFYSGYPLQPKEAYRIPLEVVSFSANGIERPQNNIELEHFENDVEIDVHAISFNRENVTFEYQLNKDAWKPFLGELKFSELSHGSFDLNIRAKDNFMASDVISLSFVIHPPWWKTSWFYLLVAAFLALIVYLFFKIKVLTYNKDVVRELLLLLRNKLKPERFIIVKDVKDGSNCKVLLDEVLFLKSSGNYVEIHKTGNQKLVVRTTLKALFDLLQKAHINQFLKVHKSYLVNVEKVAGIHAEFLKLGQHSVPIGKKAQEEVRKRFKELKGG